MKMELDSCDVPGAVALGGRGRGGGWQTAGWTRTGQLDGRERGPCAKKRKQYGVTKTWVANVGLRLARARGLSARRCGHQQYVAGVLAKYRARRCGSDVGPGSARDVSGPCGVPAAPSGLLSGRRAAGQSVARTTRPATNLRAHGSVLHGHRETLHLSDGNPARRPARITNLSLRRLRRLFASRRHARPTFINTRSLPRRRFHSTQFLDETTKWPTQKGTCRGSMHSGSGRELRRNSDTC